MTIRFTITPPACDRIHHVTPDDVRILLDRLPLELKSRLRAVHFNDRGRGGRRLGYVTENCRDISLCALAPRLSFTRFLVPGQSPAQFGAARGKQWPPLAIRRFILYDVFLHELGHLQVVHHDHPSNRRKFAMEPKAQEFAVHWCAQLWATPFPHPDPVHNKPAPEEFLDPDPEISELLRRIQRDPADAVLRVRLARHYHDRQMADEEKAAWENALALEPKNPYHHLYLAAWHYARREYQAAIPLYTQAATLDPSLPASYWCLAEAHERLGNLDLANLSFEKAVAASPADPVARRKLAAWRRRQTTP